jgi:hypothetical protein
VGCEFWDPCPKCEGFQGNEECGSYFFVRQVKKHLKKTEGNPGGIITMEAPMHVSNVQLIDPVNG